MNRRLSPPVLLLALLLAVPAAADDWEDARRDRLEDAVRALEEAAGRPGRTPESGVALRHGDVRVVGDLARVDVVLEIHNPSQAAIQWQRSFEIDPGAELIGAVLERQTAARIQARTLTLEGARRIYGEVTRPPPTPTWRRPPTGDPLRLERPSDDRLDIAVWPVTAGETLRVHLEFVTPLRGRGMARVYRDVIAGDLGGSTAPPNGDAVPTAPDRAPDPGLSLALETDWLVHPGSLTPEGLATGMVAAGRAGDVYRYVAAAGGQERVPTLPLGGGRDDGTAIAVRGGGLMSRVAVWRFDPAVFVREHALALPSTARLHVVPRRGSTVRIAPAVFAPDDEPLPVTARLSPDSPTLRYAVEVRDRAGTVLQVVEIDREVARVAMEPELEGAVTGWHRAMLVRRVLAWAGEDAAAQETALAYAVDLGVLVRGTAALAVPPDELTRVTRASRREYRRDGAVLGAQDGEADFEAPPRGSLDDKVPVARGPVR